MAMPVKFSAPPVAEVVCGVLFNNLPIKTVHIGLLWEKYRKEFPRFEEQGLIAPVIEVAPNSFEPPTFNISTASIPELRRIWFLDVEGKSLIQVQEDRFLFNWKRVDGDTDPYPSFDKIYARFETYFAIFKDFLAEHKIGDVSPRQFELTYVNLIGDRNGRKETGTFGILTDHRRASSSQRFLPEPEKFNWVTSYLLPKELGRLHIVAQSALMRSTGEKVLKLELTSRGFITAGADMKQRQAWFDLAHEWITFGFADSTNEILHKIWGRTS